MVLQLLFYQIIDCNFKILHWYLSNSSFFFTKSSFKISSKSNYYITDSIFEVSEAYISTTHYKKYLSMLSCLVGDKTNLDSKLGRLFVFTMLKKFVGSGRQRGSYFPLEFFYFWPKRPTKSFWQELEGPTETRSKKDVGNSTSQKSPCHFTK